MMNKNITIRDIAMEANVSTMTVTRAFRENSLLKEETRKRVLEVAEKLNFIPNFNAKGLRGSNTMSIGILISNPFGNDIARQLSLSLMKSKYVCFIADSLSDKEIVKEGLLGFYSRKTSGVILQWRDHYKTDKRIMELLNHLHNVVLLCMHERCDDLPYDICTLDYECAYEDAISQLLKTGRRKIVYLGRNDQPYTHVCLEILKGKGIYTGDSLIETSVYPSKPVFENYYDALNNRLLSGNIPDAIFTANDTAAAQTCKCLKAHNFKVPDDVAVIGFGNKELSIFSYPPIASINENNDKTAEKIYEMLIRRINNPAAERRHAKINCSYVSRESAMIKGDI